MAGHGAEAPFGPFGSTWTPGEATRRAQSQQRGSGWCLGAVKPEAPPGLPAGTQRAAGAATATMSATTPQGSFQAEPGIGRGGMLHMHVASPWDSPLGSYGRPFDVTFPASTPLTVRPTT